MLGMERLASLGAVDPSLPAAPEITGVPLTYYAGVIVILFQDFFSLTQITHLFYDCYSSLPAIVRSYGLLLLWDWYLVVMYLARDVYTLSIGYLDEGLWCQALGFANIAGVLALRLSAAVTAYATYRLAKGKALDDRTFAYAHAASWIMGTLLATLFFFNNAYGPYKGLYCCIREDRYQTYATGPCFVVTFSSMCIVALCYFQANREVERRQKAGSPCSPETQVIVRRGALHGLAFYLLWSLVITAGTVTALGGRVPVMLDVLAAWLVKLEPSIDSFLLIDTITLLLPAHVHKTVKTQ